MLAPEYLAKSADDVIKIYSQLELDVIKFMAERINLDKSVSWQSKMLVEAGAVRERIEQLIMKYDKNIQEAILKSFAKAVKESIKNDNKIYIKAIGKEITEGHEQILLSMLRKTHGDLRRLTMTTASATEHVFIKQVNNAYMAVHSGAMSYDDALCMAVDNLADNGTRVILYNNKTPTTRSIESAVKMNIRTGINQTASAITLENCKELGSDLVETTAHIGARPEHEIWQGQVFSLSGNSTKYPSFDICRYGEPDGICGINCRHSFYPYFEDIEQRYTEKDTEEMEEWRVDVDGKEHTRYEAEQKLRYMERQARTYQKREIAESACGIDSTKSNALKMRWQEKAMTFAKETNQHFIKANFKVGEK